MAADANRASLGYIVESTFGTTPTTPSLAAIRITGESLQANTGTTTSEELRSDRQRSDVVRVDFSTGGEINYELSYGEFDVFMAAALQSTWGSDTADIGSGMTSLAFDATAGTITGTGGTWGTTPSVGDIIRVSSAEDAANNGFYKVSAANSTVITVTEGAGAFTGNASDTAAVIDIPASVTNGTTLLTYSIEKQFEDASGTTDEFQVFTGMGVDTWSMNIEPAQIITGSFGFLGKSVASAGATADAGGGYTASATGAVMNAVDNVSKMVEGTSALTTVTGLSFSLANNLRARAAIGTLGAISLGSGTVDVTGTLRAYFESEALIDKYFNYTASNLFYHVADAAGDNYVFDFPRVKYTNGRVLATGLNQDVLVELDWTAYRNSTEDVTMRVVRMT